MAELRYTGRPPLTLEEREAIKTRWAEFASKGHITPLPPHSKVWSDARAALDHIKMVEFLLGFAPEKPRAIDWEAVELQLGDARAVLDHLCLTLSDEAADL